jgi:hypothetical protein
MQPGIPQTDVQLAEMATGIYARHEQLREQIAALGQDLEERERRLAAQVSSLIETAAKAAKIDPDAARSSIGRGAAGEGERSEA